MYFGESPTAEAKGCFLAHSIKVNGLRVRKGEQLTENRIEQLLAAGVEQLIVARLEAGDVHEDQAAFELATALAGGGVYLGEARTGRVNLYAKETGLLEINRDLVLACNRVSDAITFATLNENLWVPRGKLVATAKIIPFGVDAEELHAAIVAGSNISSPSNGDNEANTSASAVCLHAPKRKRAHLVQTQVAGTAAQMLAKTEQVTRDRLATRGAELVSATTCTHSADALFDCVSQLTSSDNCNDNDWILIAGASAISDTRDVIPSSIKRLGGKVKRLGIPVDPGNLLLLGEIAGHTVIGLPGCARSPKHNGFDLFLDRLSCDQEISERWIQSLAVGGLLNEIPERPQQRSRPQTFAEDQLDKPRQHVAIVLAAGRSRRFGKSNKLLATHDNKPLLQHTLETLASSSVDEILVVTGHEHESLEKMLSGLLQTLDEDTFAIGTLEKPVTLLHNSLYAQGLSTSVRTAVSYLTSRHDKPSRSDEETAPDGSEATGAVEAATPMPAILVCLGDMPSLRTDTVNTLVNAAKSASARDEEVSAFIPCHEGRRGNPVLMTSGLFDSLLSLNGDSGARKLIEDSPAIVREVNVDDPGVLLDIDTVQQLDDIEPRA